MWDCLQSREVEYTQDRAAELDSLKSVIEGLKSHSEELEAELQVLRDREQQHLVDLEQAHATILDLRQAAQQAAESQAVSSSAALEQAVSCR